LSKYLSDRVMSLIGGIVFLAFGIITAIWGWFTILINSLGSLRLLLLLGFGWVVFYVVVLSGLAIFAVSWALNCYGFLWLDLCWKRPIRLLFLSVFALNDFQLFFTGFLY
jgi:hypothetical protein